MLDSSKIKVGIAPINWSNDDLLELGGDISFDTCILQMNQAGYQGCEIGNKFPRDAVVLRSKLEPLDLSIASGWFSCFFTDKEKYNQTIDQFNEHLEFLEKMGANVVVVAECGDCIHQDDEPVTHTKPLFNSQQWDLLIEGMEHLGQIAKQKNMDIVYHPHMGTGIQVTSEIDILMNNTSEDLVSLLLDTGHLYFAGACNLDIIDRYHNRIKHVHLKDIRANVLQEVREKKLSFLQAVQKGVFTVPGDGAINFKPIFKALKEHNYSGWFIIEAEQDPKLAPPLEYAKKGRKYLLTTAGI